MEENKKPKIFTVLKVLAPILLIGGAVMIILGIVLSQGNGPEAGLLVPGVFLVFISIFLLFVAFMPNINKTMIKTAKYLQEDNKDDLTQIMDTSADITKGAITKTAKAVKDGLKDYKYCRFCGEKIEEDSQFCKHCGKKQ